MMSTKGKKFDIWSTITFIIFMLYIILLAFPLFTILVKSIGDGTTGSF